MQQHENADVTSDRCVVDIKEGEVSVEMSTLCLWKPLEGFVETNEGSQRMAP